MTNANARPFHYSAIVAGPDGLLHVHNAKCRDLTATKYPSFSTNDVLTGFSTFGAIVEVISAHRIEEGATVDEVLASDYKVFPCSIAEEAPAEAELLEDFEVGAPLEVPTELLDAARDELELEELLEECGRLVTAPLTAEEITAREELFEQKDELVGWAEGILAARALRLAEAIVPDAGAFDPTELVEIGAVVAHVLTVDELLAHRDGQPREFHDGRCSRCGSEISYRFVKAHAGYGYGHLDGTPAQSSCSRVTADELKAGLRAALAIALDEEPAR